MQNKWQSFLVGFLVAEAATWHLEIRSEKIELTGIERDRHPHYPVPVQKDLSPLFVRQGLDYLSLIKSIQSDER